MMPILTYRHWRDAVGSPDWTWPHFSPQEMASGSGGALMVDSEFMDRLEGLRFAFGAPLTVTSGYRTPEHNRLVSETGPTGPHTQGRACDVRIAGIAAYRLIRLALALEFRGIGVKQHGLPAGRFVHLDMVEDGRPTVWSYP